MEQEIKMRRATKEDAATIARAVAMAVGYDTQHPLYSVFLTLAAMEQTQYSYCNAIIAEVDSEVVGAVVGYDGARLAELREPIFPLLERSLGHIPEIEDETEAGEFYVDSLGVWPEWRGRGIGGRLLAAMRDKAHAEGFARVGLIVDFDNPKAEMLYSSLGFKRVGEKRFLGHKMWHMVSE